MNFGVTLDFSVMETCLPLRTGHGVPCPYMEIDR